MQWHFLWPQALLVGLAVPAFLWLYIRAERRSHASARRYPALYPNPCAGSGMRAVVRHAPAAFIASTLALLSLALGRPAAILTFLPRQGSVVLAIDVSESMLASDVKPTRLAEAKKIAKHFVADHADTLRIGLVSFAGTAIAEADLPTGKEELLTAIDRLGQRPGTSVGRGIIQSLDMLLPRMDVEAIAQQLIDAEADDGSAAAAKASSHAAQRAPGSLASAAIVLLSDGQATLGPAPSVAARLAADFGVRVHTIGIGSIEGSVLRAEGWSMRVQLEEAPLQNIARLTAATYAHARKGVDWRPVTASIRTDQAEDETYTEITALFAALAALTAVVGALASLLRTQRIL